MNSARTQARLRTAAGLPTGGVYGSPALGSNSRARA